MVCLGGCAYITLEQLSVSIWLTLHHQGIPRIKIDDLEGALPTWGTSTSKNLLWQCHGSQIYLRTPSQDFSSAPAANVPLLPQLPPVLTGVRAGNWHRWHRPTWCWYVLILLLAAAKLFQPSSGTVKSGMNPGLCIPIWHDFWHAFRIWEVGRNSPRTYCLRNGGYHLPAKPSKPAWPAETRFRQQITIQHAFRSAGWKIPIYAARIAMGHSTL